MLVIVKGAGDLATGIAWRLNRCGFSVICTEAAQPTAVRRTVSFCQAVFDGECTVEGITARLCSDPEEAVQAAAPGIVPVLVDPAGACIDALRPDVVVDAILAKRNLGTRRTDAPLVIGVGPGFTAGEDCHCVIETKRGQMLGRCIWAGSAIPNTGVPGNVGGHTTDRVLRAPHAGVFRAVKDIGDWAEQGQTVAFVEDTPVTVSFSGYLRGMLQSGLSVTEGFKLGDIDSVCEKSWCFLISDKALAIGGGVLEAILSTPTPASGSLGVPPQTPQALERA